MRCDVLIIGAGPGGASAAKAAKLTYPDKDVLIVSGNKNPAKPCGIPYMFTTLADPRENGADLSGLVSMGVRIIHDHALKIDHRNHVVECETHRIEYGKLILATGSVPNRLACEGSDRDGVFAIHKDVEHIRKVREAYLDADDIVIIGGGYVGVELAYEFARHQDKRITLVEYCEHVLSHSYDHEIARYVHEALAARGVRLMTGAGVECIDEHRIVRLSNGEKLRADLVLVSIGAHPNVDLAINSGFDLKDGFVEVDDHQRTRYEDVYAVGDCAHKTDFLTGKACRIMLATGAVLEGRVCGENLYGIRTVRSMRGVIGTSTTDLDELTFASSGVTEADAKRAGFSFISVMLGSDHEHPCSLPSDDHRVLVKALFLSESRSLIGVQLMGSDHGRIEELANTANVLIQHRLTIDDLLGLQTASHPYLSGSLMTHPLVAAAEIATDALRSKQKWM
jgi:NADH oxidase (H2O2-forming)